MRVRYTPRARGDLGAILRYIDSRSPQGARNLKQAIRKAISLIGEFPSLGRPGGEPATRVLPVGRYPYLIYWSVEAEDEVWILHIRHAARRPWQEPREG